MEDAMSVNIERLKAALFDQRVGMGDQLNRIRPRDLAAILVMVGMEVKDAIEMVEDPMNSFGWAASSENFMCGNYRIKSNLCVLDLFTKIVDLESRQV